MAKLEEMLRPSTDNEFAEMAKELGAKVREHWNPEAASQGVATPWDRWFIRLWFWFLRFWRSPIATAGMELRDGALYATDIRLTRRERLRRWWAWLWRKPLRITMGTGQDGGTIVLRGLDESGQPIEERVSLPLAGTSTTSRQKFASVGGLFGNFDSEPHDDEPDHRARANHFHRRAQRAEGLLARRVITSEEEAYRQIRQLEDAHARMRVNIQQLRRQLADLRAHASPQPLNDKRCGGCPHVFAGAEHDFCNIFGGMPLQFVGLEDGSYVRLEACKKKQPASASAILNGLAFDIKDRPDEEGFHWFLPEGGDSWEPVDIFIVEKHGTSPIWTVRRLLHSPALLDATLGKFIGPCEITVLP